VDFLTQGIRPQKIPLCPPGPERESPPAKRRFAARAVKWYSYTVSVKPTTPLDREKISVDATAPTRRWPRTRPIEILRTAGLRETAYRALAALGVYRKMIITTNTCLVDPNAAGPAEIQIDRLERNDCEEYCTAIPTCSLAQIQRRLDRGMIGLVARHEGKTVATSWVALDHCPVDYLGVDLPLRPGAAYLFEAWVAPQWRGRRVISQIGRVERRIMREAGCNRYIGLVWWFNRKATELHLRRGGGILGTVHRLKLGPLQRVWINYEDPSDPVFGDLK
jgi:hypothetical protein